MDHIASGSGKGMQRDYIKIIRNILWGLIGFNIMTVLFFIIPFFLYYCIFGIFYSGIIGSVITGVLLVIRRKKQKIFEKNMIILFILFVLTIPLGKLLFEIAMSV